MNKFFAAAGGCGQYVLAAVVAGLGLGVGWIVGNDIPGQIGSLVKWGAVQAYSLTNGITSGLVATAKAAMATAPTPEPPEGGKKK